MVKVLIIFAVALFIFIRLVITFSDKIKFYSQGADSGFTPSEISLLWRLANLIELEDPMALFWSVPALNRSITGYIEDCQRKETINSPKTQNFLSKLYKFRTSIDIESSKKKGLESTKFLDKGQKLRIIFQDQGVFSSEILNNGRELIIRTPLQKRVEKIPGDQWVGKKVSVYLWRKGDANYAFDTMVTNSGMFNANKSIYLAHTSELSRMQKRKSVRAECSLPCDLYFFEDENKVDFEAVEKEKGYKCLLEDISEDGALIRCGGKGRKDVKIKLQFEIGQNLIVMYGMVRAVEYNEKMNQSRLHFECLQIKKEMKNHILSFVYNILPQEQKNILEALKMTEEDEAGAAEEQAEKDVMEILSEKSEAAVQQIAQMKKMQEENEAAVVENVENARNTEKNGEEEDENSLQDVIEQIKENGQNR